MISAFYGVSGTGQYADRAKTFAIIHVFVVLERQDPVTKDLGKSLFIEHLCSDALCQHAFQQHLKCHKLSSLNFDGVLRFFQFTQGWPPISQFLG